MISSKAALILTGFVVFLTAAELLWHDKIEGFVQRLMNGGRR